MLDLATIGIGMDTSGLVAGTAALRNTEQAANRTADAADKLGAKTGTLGQKALATGSDFSRMNSELDKVNATFGRFTSLIAGVVSVSAIVIATREAMALSLQMERYANTLKFASGSNEAFIANTEFLRTTVRAMGLDLQSASQQFASLTAAARGTALEGSGVRSIFDAVAKASTTMGLTAEQTSGSLLAIQQMISKGTVSAEELRGQLGERLPGAFQTAARAMNVTTGELGKMLEQGALATDVFLPRFAAQMRLDMAGSVKEASDSVQANLNRVKSDWATLVTTVNNSAFSNETLKGIDQFLTAFTSTLKKSGEDFKGWGDTIADTLAFVGDAVSSAFNVINSVAKAFGGAAALVALKGQEIGEITNLPRYAPGRNDMAEEIRKKYSAQAQAVRDGVNEAAQAVVTGSTKFRDALAKQRADIASTASDPEFRKMQERALSAQNAADRALLATTPTMGGKPAKGGGGGASAYDGLANAIQQQLALAQEELAMGEKLSAADKFRESTITKLSQAYADGKITWDQWNKGYDATIKASDARALADNTAAYLKHVEALKVSNAEMENEVETGQKLSAAQKNALKVLTEITNGTRKYTEVQMLALNAELERSINLESLNKQQSAQRDLDAKATDSLAKEVESLRASNEAMKLHNEEIGLTEKGLSELILKRQDEAIAIQQGIVAESREIAARSGATSAMQLEINKLDELIKKRELTASGNASKAAVQGQKEAQDAIKKTEDAAAKAAEGINNTLTDALMRGFESGKGFAETFRDTVVNMFKTLILRPTIQAILNPISQGLGGLLGGGSGGSGGFGLGDLLGGVSSLTSIGSAIGTGITGTIANILPGSISAGLGLTSTALATGNAALIGGGTSATLAANTAALAGNATALGGVGSALAAIPGWGWAALGAVALLSMAGGNFKSSWSTGNTQINSDASGNTLAAFSNQEGRPMTAESTNAATGMRDTYLATARALGIGTRATEFSYAGNSGAQGESPNFALSGGVVGLGGFTQGETKITDEAVKLAASRAIFATLQNSDLPKYLSGIFDGMKAADMGQNQIDSVLASAQAFKGLHDQLESLPVGFENLKDAAFPALKALVEFSGGFDKLTANIATYHDRFFTEAEKAATATGQVAKGFADLGYTMPVLDENARKAFRAIVDGVDLTAEGGPKTYASLMALSGAFDQLVSSSDAVRNSIQNMVDGVHKSVSDSIFNMQYGQEDNAGKYRMLDVRAAKTNDDLMAATDIGQISKLANDQIALLNQAFALLDPDQQKNSYAEFEARLTDIDEYVSSKGADAISVAKENAAQTADTIAAAVKLAVSEAMVASSAAFGIAATNIQAAAAIPAVANISVTVTKTPGVEVAIDESSRY